MLKGCLNVVLLIFIASIAAAIFGSGSDTDNNTATGEASGITAPQQPPLASETTIQTSYVARLADAVEQIGRWQPADRFESLEAIMLAVAMMQVWAELVAEQDTSTLAPEALKARTTLYSALSVVQKRMFPRLRDDYGPVVRQRLWEHDGKARTIGTGFRTVEFVAGAFAANRNIKSMQESLYPTLMQLRFTRAQYKWFDHAAELTYYTIDPPADETIAVWRNSAFVIVAR